MARKKKYVTRNQKLLDLIDYKVAGILPVNM